MNEKLAVNQRIRELMAALGFPNNVDGFYKKYFGEGRSEKLRTVVKDINPIKTDFLVEIAEKIAQVDGKKIDGHWLLTGDGEIFLPENSDSVKTQLLIDTQRELLSQYRARISRLEEEVTDLRARLAHLTASGD